MLLVNRPAKLTICNFIWLGFLNMVLDVCTYEMIAKAGSFSMKIYEVSGWDVSRYCCPLLVATSN